MPIGQITRGTTGHNRLRRVDRWIAQLPALRRAQHPLIVDLGYGASATTTLELYSRLSRVRADIEVMGIEIDQERVDRANESARPGVRFRHGGFEIPGEAPIVIRALNVLRQYREGEVYPAWERMVGRLQPGGVLVEGTCSEIGRVASWVDVTAEGPQSLTVSLHLPSLSGPEATGPSVVAERLPKVLIHRNIPGEPIYDFVRDLDRYWAVHAGLGVHSPRQRWIAVAQSMKKTWPVHGTQARWRLGELSVDWNAVAPKGH